MKVGFLGYLVLCFILISVPLVKSKANENSVTEFEKWKIKRDKDLSVFIEQYDKDFASFLKNNWIETDVNKGTKRDIQPKPKKSPEKQPKPIVDEAPVPIVLPEINPTPDVIPTPEITPLPDTIIPNKPPVIKPKSPFYYAEQGSGIKVFILGQSLTLPKIALPKLNMTKLSSNDISDMWLVMAATKFQQPIIAIQQAGKDLKLDDWGQALLTHKYLTALSDLTTNERKLYMWFYLVKQSFDARIAFDKNTVYLMLNTEQVLYEQKYFTLDEQRFYFVDFSQKRPINVGSVYTYKQQHSSAKEKVKIDMSIAPLQGKSDKTRVLMTKVGDKSVSVTALYNSQYIEFLDFYPQVSMEYYFKAELPEQTKVSLLGQLKTQIIDMSELEAANFLLHFVQTSLAYKTDQQQFNYENYLFAGETLHYPYADCEDRSVLFAYLIKHLMGNEVVGLQYDGHIATAVALKSHTNGATFLINGTNYTVADPTFINANIGEVMTDYEGVTPKFVMF